MIAYHSTRGGGGALNFEEVLLAGLAPDGGLYVPEELPQLDLETLKGKSYREVAFNVMFPFVAGCIPEKDFIEIIEHTYNRKIFPNRDITPLVQLNHDLYVMEQFRGPTMAFKDVALQLLGRLFDYVLKKRGGQVTIVGATSGDTGSAAIEGCRHADRTQIYILHPKGRVSEVQRRQMTTVLADNVHNIALEGTFDDCQNAVKAMFRDAAFRGEMNLTAVNSINWARIMAQIVYYVHSALDLGAPDTTTTYIVPTGNFGNVLAGYYARKMGVPLRLVVATNQNDILTRFFETGKMEARDVVASLSPSMDIQISSNFERYLYDLLNQDSRKLGTLMTEFAKTGQMSFETRCLNRALLDFNAFRTDEAGTLETIKDIYERYDYVLDPHTAVGMRGAEDYKTSGPVVVLATAHPAKFPDAVEKAIGQRPALPPYLSDLFERQERMDVLPNDLQAIQAFIRG